MKSYSVRFYVGNVPEGPQRKPISQVLSEIVDSIQENGSACQVADGSVKYELRDMVSLNDGASFKGVLAVLRDDAPHIRGANGIERDIVLAQDEHIIEKNHFLFYRENEMIVWQVNGKGSHVHRLELYLSQFSNQTITCEDIIDKNSVDRLARGVIRGFKFKIAKPKRGVAEIAADDWAFPTLKLLQGSEASSITVDVKTGSRQRGLAGRVKDSIYGLIKSEHVKSMQVRLQNVEQPIDLFADCITDAISVQMIGLYPSRDAIFAELAAAKDRQRSQLDAYFNVGGVVLES